MKIKENIYQICTDCKKFVPDEIPEGSWFTDWSGARRSQLLISSGVRTCSTGNRCQGHTTCQRSSEFVKINR